MTGEGAPRGRRALPPPEAPPSTARRDRVLRRGLKFAGLLVLVYYDLPSKVFGVPVYWAIPLGAALVALVEVARLTHVLPLPAVRPYEATRPAGYVYWGASLGLLVAFFPESFAVAVLISSSVADVLAGEARTVLRWAPARSRLLGAFLPFALLSFGLLAWLSPEGLAVSAALAVVGALGAAAVEGRMMSALDDDLVMPLLPALLWVGLVHVMPGSVPLGFHTPWVSRG